MRCQNFCLECMYVSSTATFKIQLIYKFAYKMMSKRDVNTQYVDQLDRYRSQQAIIKALLAVKEDVVKIEPCIAESIHVTYLSNDLKMDRDEVDSLFGNFLFCFCVCLHQLTYDF